MKPDKIMELIVKDGVKISKDESGKIKVVGDQKAVEKWLPVIAEHKEKLSDFILKGSNNLAATPGQCQTCTRFEFVKNMGMDVPGCLYQITGGEWTEGWKRLSIDLKKCVIA